jgi:hypothetical protein
MEQRRHSNEQPNIEGELAIRFDIASGQIDCRGSGFWSVGQAEAFFDDWTAVVRRIHLGGRSVSALVDLAAGAIQKAEVADIIGTATAGLYMDGDAIAMLVPTSLAKMQMRRLLDARFHDFFLSRSAAETWLQGRRLAADAQHQVTHQAM